MHRAGMQLACMTLLSGLGNPPVDLLVHAAQLVPDVDAPCGVPSCNTVSLRVQRHALQHIGTMSWAPSSMPHWRDSEHDGQFWVRCGAVCEPSARQALAAILHRVVRVLRSGSAMTTCTPSMQAPAGHTQSRQLPRQCPSSAKGPAHCQLSATVPLASEESTYADALGQDEVHGAPGRLLRPPDLDVEALVGGPIGAVCAHLHIRAYQCCFGAYLRYISAMVCLGAPLQYLTLCKVIGPADRKLVRQASTRPCDSCEATRSAHTCLEQVG